MDVHDHHYNKEFAAKIIRCKGDRLSNDWEEIRQNEEKSGNLKKPVKMFLPESVLISFFKEKDGKDVNNVVEIFAGLQQAFLSLHIYAANLCGDTVKVDYSLLKTYTGYYAVNVSSCVSNHAEILKQMGYLPNEYNDEFELGNINKDIEKIAYELFLNHLYCRRMKIIMYAVALKKNDLSLAKHIFKYSSKDDFHDSQIEHYCEQFMRSPPVDVTKAESSKATMGGECGSVSAGVSAFSEPKKDPKNIVSRDEEIKDENMYDEEENTAENAADQPDRNVDQNRTHRVAQPHINNSESCRPLQANSGTFYQDQDMKMNQTMSHSNNSQRSRPNIYNKTVDVNGVALPPSLQNQSLVMPEIYNQPQQHKLQTYSYPQEQQQQILAQPIGSINSGQHSHANNAQQLTGNQLFYSTEGIHQQNVNMQGLYHQPNMQIPGPEINRQTGLTQTVPTQGHIMMQGQTFSGNNQQQNIQMSAPEMRQQLGPTQTVPTQGSNVSAPGYTTSKMPRN